MFVRRDLGIPLNSGIVSNSILASNAFFIFLKARWPHAMKIVDRRKLERIRKPGSDKTEFDKVMAR